MFERHPVTTKTRSWPNGQRSKQACPRQGRGFLSWRRCSTQPFLESSQMLDPSPERLLVDLSPASPPDEAEVRAWASGRSVFVSSVITGMERERKACAQGIAAMGAMPVFFEAFGGMDDDPEDAYLGHVENSDIYLGTLGQRYGKPLKSGYSATHAEYDEAMTRGRRISIWNSAGELDGRQQDFLEEVRVFHTTGSYSSPEDLALGVERRLRVIAAEAIAPWAKVGNAILRVTSVHDDGLQITVKARIRDNTVAANLEARRPGNGYGRHSETRITWPGGTSPVRVASVTSETTSTQSRTMTIVGNRLPEVRSTHLEVAYEGHSPEELTELAIRVTLLGEPNPLGYMSFLVGAENPLRSIANLRLSEDSFEQIALLLIVEELVGRRGVDHITRFRLGPQHLRASSASTRLDASASIPESRPGRTRN